MKRGITILFIASIFITLPFISAGLFDFFKKDAQLSPQEARAQVGNADIIIQDPMVSITPPIITAGGTDPVNIVFRVKDNNGNADIDDSSLNINIDYSGGGETTRSGTIADCSTLDIGNNIREYDCNINMYYYDAAGTWNIVISISDLGTPTSSDTDSDDSFTVSQLKAIDPTPLTINFGNVVPAQTDIESLTPTTVENQGNFNEKGFF